MMEEHYDIREAELKPCPFCGYAPNTYDIGDIQRMKLLITCESELCDVWPHVEHREPDVARKRWNRRAAPPSACPVEGAETTLAQCPIGLFVCNGELCLKTEYGNNEGRIDAYIVSSGEFFWGDAPQSIANQRAQIVRPVDRRADPQLVKDNQSE